MSTAIHIQFPLFKKSQLRKNVLFREFDYKFIFQAFLTTTTTIVLYIFDDNFRLLLFSYLLIGFY